MSNKKTLGILCAAALGIGGLAGTMAYVSLTTDTGNKVTSTAEEKPHKQYNLSSPEATIDSFFEAMINKDYAGMRNCLSDEIKEEKDIGKLAAFVTNDPLANILDKVTDVDASIYQMVEYEPGKFAVGVKKEYSFSHVGFKPRARNNLILKKEDGKFKLLYSLVQIKRLNLQEGKRIESTIKEKTESKGIFFYLN